MPGEGGGGMNIGCGCHRLGKSGWVIYLPSPKCSFFLVFVYIYMCVSALSFFSSLAGIILLCVGRGLQREEWERVCFGA